MLNNVDNTVEKESIEETLRSYQLLFAKYIYEAGTQGYLQQAFRHDYQAILGEQEIERAELPVIESFEADCQHYRAVYSSELFGTGRVNKARLLEEQQQLRLGESVVKQLVKEVRQEFHHACDVYREMYSVDLRDDGQLNQDILNTEQDRWGLGLSIAQAIASTEQSTFTSDQQEYRRVAVHAIHQFGQLDSEQLRSLHLQFGFGPALVKHIHADVEAEFQSHLQTYQQQFLDMLRHNGTISDTEHARLHGLRQSLGNINLTLLAEFEQTAVDTHQQNVAAYAEEARQVIQQFTDGHFNEPTPEEQESLIALSHWFDLSPAIAAQIEQGVRAELMAQASIQTEPTPSDENQSEMTGVEDIEPDTSVVTILVDQPSENSVAALEEDTDASAVVASPAPEALNDVTSEDRKDIAPLTAEPMASSEVDDATINEMEMESEMESLPLIPSEATLKPVISKAASATPSANVDAADVQATDSKLDAKDSASLDEDSLEPLPDTTVISDIGLSDQTVSVAESIDHTVEPEFLEQEGGLANDDGSDSDQEGEAIPLVSPAIAEDGAGSESGRDGRVSATIDSPPTLDPDSVSTVERSEPEWSVETIPSKALMVNKDVRTSVEQEPRGISSAPGSSLFEQTTPSQNSGRRWLAVGAAITAGAMLIGGGIVAFRNQTPQSLPTVDLQSNTVEVARTEHDPGVTADATPENEASPEGVSPTDTIHNESGQTDTFPGETLTEVQRLIQERQVVSALDLLATVPTNENTTYEVDGILRQVVQQAEAYYQEGLYTEAITVINTMSQRFSNQEITAEAVIASKEWQNRWHASLATLKVAENALDNQQYDSAIAEAQKVNHPGLQIEVATIIDAALQAKQEQATLAEQARQQQVQNRVPPQSGSPAPRTTVAPSRSAPAPRPTRRATPKPASQPAAPSPSPSYYKPDPL